MTQSNANNNNKQCDSTFPVYPPGSSHAVDVLPCVLPRGHEPPHRFDHHHSPAGDGASCFCGNAENTVCNGKEYYSSCSNCNSGGKVPCPYTEQPKELHELHTHEDSNTCPSGAPMHPSGCNGREYYMLCSCEYAHEYFVKCPSTANNTNTNTNTNKQSPGVCWRCGAMPHELEGTEHKILPAGDVSLCSYCWSSA